MRVDGRKLGHEELERIRFAAVRAVRSGETATAVARRMGLYPNRVFLWLAAYRKGGWQALRARKASGRPRRLDAQQIRWIHTAVTRNSPLSLDLPSKLWTRAQLRALIARKFGVKLSAVSVGRLMTQLGLICPRSLFDTGSLAAQQWLQQKYPQIRAQAKHAAADIFFAHEAVVHSEPPRTAASAGIEKPSSTKTTARVQTLLCVSSGKSAPRFMVVNGNVRAGVLVDFLQRLMYQRTRPLYLLLTDRAALRSVKVRTYVESLDGMLQLLLLPSFCAESGSSAAERHDIRVSAAADNHDHGVA